MGKRKRSELAQGDVDITAKDKDQDGKAGHRLSSSAPSKTLPMLPSDDGQEKPRRTKEEKRERKERKRAAKLAKKLDGTSESESMKRRDASLPTPIKNGGVHRETDPVSIPEGQGAELMNVPESEIEAFLKLHGIKIIDPSSSKLRPIVSFQHLPPDTAFASSLLKDFKSPTPIQAAAWPFVLLRRDVVGIAETGSGKTLAFGVPCIASILKGASESSTNGSKSGKVKGIRAAVVTPTRELALQIYEQLRALVAKTKLSVTCIFGGMPKKAQRTSLKTANVIVATPGRLNDFIQEGAASLTDVGFLVLDEADRMLDKGFKEDVKKIVAAISNPTCQTLMFTATWPQSVRELAATFMKKPVEIFIGDNPTGDLRANTQIHQIVEVIEPHAKQPRLIQLLKEHQSGSKSMDRVLVFCLYKKEATRIEGFIQSRGFSVAGIHGDLAQTQRTKALAAFKAGEVPILVATDVAARGLDIPAVKVVINVTFPLTVEDYVHRIGRTGRAGKSGIAITMFTEHDKKLSGELINVLKQADQTVPEDLLKFGSTVKRKTHDVYGAFHRDIQGDMPKATKIIFD